MFSDGKALALNMDFASITDLTSEAYSSVCSCRAAFHLIIAFWHIRSHSFGIKAAGLKMSEINFTVT